ncbi:MAG: penicillin-binding protein 2 [bacterium]
MNQSAIDQQFEARLQRSLVWFRYFIIATLSILFIRIFSLQIVKKGELYKLSEANRIQLFFDPAPRGIIYDRNGKVIVENIGSFSVLFSPTNLTWGETEEILKKLSEILNLNYDSMLAKVRSSIRQPLSSILLAENVPRPKVFCLAEEKVNLPGVNIEVEPKRHYLHRNFASHLFGHLGEIGPKELLALSGAGYKLGDIIGKSGIEKIYDNFLRGMSGGRQIEIDANGRHLRIINNVLPEEGDSLILTLDERIQKLCEDSLEGKAGAICAINPANGEVLALVSKPDFDPNLFTERLSPSRSRQLFTDPGLPMFNRVIQSHYAPGSLFKIVTAIAALEEKVITPDETMDCRGSLRIGDREFKGWKEGGHGRLNIVQAIAQSCDIFFYQLGLRVGADKLAKYARMLGLGKKIGISLPSEARGLIPDSTWKKLHFGEQWYHGDTANMSIGQGYLEVTPLQMASLISLLANGGVIYKPLIVKKIIDGSGKIIDTFQPKVVAKARISSETLSIIRKGLREAVISGTSQAVKFKRLSVAGKTGTAENPHGEDHAWFICYAPEEAPRIALAILVEHGGHGASAAAPLARQILNGVFTLEGEKEPEIFVYKD